MWDADVLLNSCGYFGCILSVVFVVAAGFSFVGLLVDACAFFQCVLWVIVVSFGIV